MNIPFQSPMYYGPPYPFIQLPGMTDPYFNPIINPINPLYNASGPISSRYGGDSVVEKAKKNQTAKRKKKIKIKDLILIMYLMKHAKTK